VGLTGRVRPLAKAQGAEVLPICRASARAPGPLR